MADLCVSRVPIFAALTEDDQARVAALAHPVRLRAGEVASGGAAPTRLLVVHDGRFKVARLSVDGSEQVLRVLGPGDFTGEAAVLTGASTTDVVHAVEDSTACAFSHADLRGLLVRRPQVALRMLEVVSRRLEDAEDRIAGLATHDVTSRIAAHLLDLPVTRRSGRAVVTLPLAKKDVASLLDTTPESFSRGLARLVADGLVEVHGPEVTILDPTGLDDLVGR